MSRGIRQALNTLWRIITLTSEARSNLLFFGKPGYMCLPQCPAALSWLSPQGRQAADSTHKYLNLLFMDLVPVSGVPPSMRLVIKTAAVLHYRAVTSASPLTWAAP